MSKIAITISLCFLCAVNLMAQTDKLAQAFSNSYANESNGEYIQAIKDLTDVYSDGSYPLNLRLGWLNYSIGEHVKSQSYYKKAVGLEKSSIEARMGYVYPTAAMENWEDVIATYKEILAMDPNNATVNYRLSFIYFKRKDASEAIKYANKVLESYPFDFSSNYLLGQIFISQGKIVEAKARLENALLYNPSSDEVSSLLKTL